MNAFGDNADIVDKAGSDDISGGALSLLMWHLQQPAQSIPQHSKKCTSENRSIGSLVVNYREGLSMLLSLAFNYNVWF